MSSSDSEVDCYGGAVGLLDALKSQFVSHIPTTEDVPKVVQILGENADKENNTWEEIQESFQLPADILSKGLPKKKGRRKTKSPVALEGTSVVGVKNNKRITRSSQKAGLVTDQSRPSINTQYDQERQPPQTKKVKKTRKKRIVQQIPHPTFLVGEADGYVDHSEGVKLFQKSDAICVDRVSIDFDTDSEDENLDDSLVNPIMSVKVHWRSKDFHKFFIRKFQNITTIFEHFSKLDSVKWENLYFDYNGQLLKPSDTPESLGYNIGKFIEGGSVRHNVFEITTNKKTVKQKEESSKLNVKFQVANRKNPIVLKLDPQEKFLFALVKVAEELGVSRSQMKCTFDGDILDPQSSPVDLDFEGDECVDVACEQMNSNFKY